MKTHIGQVWREFPPVKRAPFTYTPLLFPAPVNPPPRRSGCAPPAPSNGATLSSKRFHSRAVRSPASTS